MRLMLTLVLSMSFFILAAVLPVEAGRAPVGVLDATLVLRTADDEARFLGSGFLYGDQGVIVTNAHVVEGQARVRIETRSGTSLVVDVVARDDLRDIAVLRAPAGLGPGLRAGPLPGIGQSVYAAGAPLGAEFTLTAGIIAAAPRQVEPHVPLRLLQHDAAVNPGSSGGPLVDAQGRLVGMNAQIADGSPYYIGIAYAISVADIARWVPALLAGTHQGPSTLGVAVRAVDRRIATALGLEHPRGALVDQVRAGTLAAAAGLIAGDIILEFGLAKVTRPGDLAFLVAALKPGQQVPVTVWRNGRLHRLALHVRAAGKGLLAAAAMKHPHQVADYDLAGLGVTLGQDGGVERITINSPAFFAGLSEGDRIVAVNGVLADGAALAGLRITQPLLLRVQRVDGSTTHLMLDPWSTGRKLRPSGGGNMLDPDVVLF